MSDLSFFWCKNCLQPEPYCDCGEDDNLETESPIQKMMRGMDRDKIWELHVDRPRNKPDAHR